MSYDLLNDLALTEYRLCNLSYEQPEKLKWSYGDCPQCKNVFCVQKTYKHKRICIYCGWPVVLCHPSE